MSLMNTNSQNGGVLTVTMVTRAADSRVPRWSKVLTLYSKRSQKTIMNLGVREILECVLPPATAVRRLPLHQENLSNTRRTTTQPSPLSHRCCACGQEFPGAYDLMLHQRTHYIRNRVPCGTHTMTAHQQTSAVKRERIPVQHQKNPKAKKSHDCVVCGKQLTEAMKLKRHMRTHTGEKPHGCSVCGRGFTQKGNLKTHMKTHRGLNALWSAGEDSPSTSGEPEQHQKKHTAKTFHNCIDCGEICQTLPALKKHMKTHTSKKPSYQCSLCGAEFTEKGQIQDHQLKHVGEKPYSCPDCGKCFVNESYIKIHQRTHTGERPYSCLVCGNSFVKKAYLKSHLLTHTGEKPYLCSICGKTYSREGTFKIHQRVHTGEKPYLCTECGKRFSCRANLYSHKKRHDGKPIGPKRQLGRPKQLPN
ncbi:uncharacterized protein ACWYII_003760 isoform 2-T3 [Salvelinus alpinus]